MQRSWRCTCGCACFAAFAWLGLTCTLRSQLSSTFKRTCRYIAAAFHWRQMWTSQPLRPGLKGLQASYISAMIAAQCVLRVLRLTLHSALGAQGLS